MWSTCLYTKSPSHLEPDLSDFTAMLDINLECEFGVLKLLFSGILNSGFLIVITWIKLYSMPRETSIICRKGGVPENEAPGKLELLFNLVLQQESYQRNMNFKMSLLKKEYSALLFKTIPNVAYSFWLRKMERACQIFQLVFCFILHHIRKDME